MPQTVTTVMELVERQAARTPEAPAVRCGSAALTYRRLEERADGLAQGLRARGVGPESVVGIALPRSVDLVVGLLGVLKSGAAYLPIDPRYPSGRLEFILADARPQLLLAAPGTDLPPTEIPRVAIQDLEPLAPTGGGRRAAPRPDHMAYVMYTSGSTGIPKGVVITHGSIANAVPRLAEIAGLRPGVVMLAGTSINFDVSVFEIFASLSAGAHVEILRDALELAERPVPTPGVVSTVPSVLTELLARNPAGLATDTVVLAGEGLPAALVEDVRLSLPGARVINAYGQTETLYATTYVVPEGRRGSGGVPIGAALENMRTHVLGPDLRPVRQGVTGELYVGGLIGRGYHDRPSLTSQRFVADPYGPPGHRMYRTGDLVRVNAEGHLEYAGRADHQIKVRGIRVEPAEIESSLTAHPQVAQAVVTAHDARLTAYVIPAGGRADIDGRRLRRFLAGRLPAYKIPSTFHVLDRLPLGPNGKVDHAALPDHRPRAPGHRRVPRTRREGALAALVADVLGQDRVGIDDDFFELGGDSALAARLVERIRAEFGVNLRVDAVVRARTVAGLGELIIAPPDAPARADRPRGSS